jgi:hypothetical protein
MIATTEPYAPLSKWSLRLLILWLLLLFLLFSLVTVKKVLKNKG